MLHILLSRDAEGYILAQLAYFDKWSNETHNGGSNLVGTLCLHLRKVFGLVDHPVLHRKLELHHFGGN